MGTSSTAIFSDDIACDVRDEFIELLSIGTSPIDATQSLIQSYASTLQDIDDGPDFWLALAATQWKYGCLSREVQTRAIEVIDSGVDLQKWEGSSVVGRRQAVLLTLKEKLLSPQPALRRPPRRKKIVVASNCVNAPDGSAHATAFELEKSPHPNAPRMQVYVEMAASGSRGGGGIFVADCEYNEVSLEWLNSETLQIAYPISATLHDQKQSLFYYGRTIQIIYQS